MDLDLVDPDLREATRKVPVVDTTRPFVLSLIQLLLPVVLRPKRVAGVTTTKVHDGSVRGHVYRPDSPSTGPAVFWIHGGGMVLGSSVQDERLIVETVLRFGITVVSVDYRLAPRHPFPAPLDDVTGAWQWVQEHAGSLGIDPERIVVAGESAGAGLAASLVQRLHDTGGVQPIAQWLFCPMLDDRTAADRSLDAVDHFVWSNSSNLFGWSSYLGHAPGAASEPDYAVAARRTDVSGLPPTWICVGDIELFHDEDVAYAERLREAGVDVTLEVVAGAPHGFENWAAGTAPAQALKERAWEWLAPFVR